MKDYLSPYNVLNYSRSVLIMFKNFIFSVKEITFKNVLTRNLNNQLQSITQPLIFWSSLFSLLGNVTGIEGNLEPPPKSATVFQIGDSRYLLTSPNPTLLETCNYTIIFSDLFIRKLYNIIADFCDINMPKWFFTSILEPPVVEGCGSNIYACNQTLPVNFSVLNQVLECAIKKLTLECEDQHNRLYENLSGILVVLAIGLLGCAMYSLKRLIAHNSRLIRGPEIAPVLSVQGIPQPLIRLIFEYEGDSKLIGNLYPPAEEKKAVRPLSPETPTIHHGSGTFLYSEREQQRGTRSLSSVFNELQYRIFGRPVYIRGRRVQDTFSGNSPTPRLTSPTRRSAKVRNERTISPGV